MSVKEVTEKYQCTDGSNGAGRIGHNAAVRGLAPLDGVVMNRLEVLYAKKCV